MSKDDYQAREAQRKADQAKQDAANQMWQKRSEDKSNRLASDRRKTQDARINSGGGCFPKGTEITTPFGPRDISGLQKGDFVIAMNRQSGEKQIRKILKKLTHRNRKIWRLEFSDGSSVSATAVHSFSINGKWKKATEIKSGDIIVSYGADGGFSQKTVTVSTETSESADVYNLIVEGDFNFVAGGVIAHSFTYFKTVRALAWSFRESSRLLSQQIKIAFQLAKKSVT